MTPTAEKLQTVIAGAIKYALTDHKDWSYDVRLTPAIAKRVAGGIESVLTNEMIMQIQREAAEKIRKDVEASTIIAHLKIKVASLERSNRYFIEKLHANNIPLEDTRNKNVQEKATANG